LISCANELIKDPTAQDALESLAALLTATGPSFDDKEWSQHGLLCCIFDRVKDLTKNKQVAPRLRFLLSDVLDLRATSWANQKKVTAKQAGPMKLEEVHSLAAKEVEQALKKAAEEKKAASKGGKRPLKAFTLEKAVSQPKLEKGVSQPKLQKAVSEPKQTVSKEKTGDDEWQTVTPKTQRTGRKTKALEKATSGNPTSNQPRVVTPPASPKVAPSPPASPKASASETSPRTFDLRAFRRELTEVMKELGASRDTARARRRFDGVKVPSHLQATEFSNLVTRVAEERCSASRRAMFAFVAGLAGSVFDKDMCAAGIKSFFDDVYDDLCEEVHRLPDILKSELVPTMRAALPAGTLYKILPSALK
jgi:hypothetical protein